MTESRPEPASTAAAVEALVRSIEAKEAQSAPVGAPVEPTARPEGDAETPASAVVLEPPPKKEKRARTGNPSPPSTTHRPPATGWAWSPTSRGPLPGLVDRQLWEALVAEEAERQHRYGRPTAIVLAELEGLDELVARMGPAAMNRLVRPCVDMLASLTRRSDRMTRLTNSRFGLLLLETDAAGAAKLAARITVAAEKRLSGSRWPVRMVVGWAGAATSEELHRAVRAAERHLRVRRG